MPALRGFKIRVTCGDSELEEYSTSFDPSKPNEVACWIPSTAGKTFCINYTWDTVELCNWSIELKCDGKRMRKSSVLSRINKFVHQGARLGDEIRALTFAPLLLTDDENAPGPAQSTQLGTISVKIWRSTPAPVKPPVKGSYGLEAEATLLEETPLFEGKKTIGVHRTKVGEVIAIRPMHLSSSKYIDTEPYLTVTFRYRSPDTLRAMGLMPSPPEFPVNRRQMPSTGPRGVKRSASHFSNDEGGQSSEEEELVAKVSILSQRIKTLRNKKRKIKREGSPIIGLAGTSGTSKNSPIILDHDDVVELSSD